MEMQAVLSAKELAERGYPVLFLSSAGARAGREAAALGIEALSLLPRGHVAPLAALRLARVLRKRSVRLVHAEYGRDLWTVVPAARIAGNVPVVLTKRLASSVDKKDPIHRWLHARTARVLAISSAIKQNLLKRTTIPEGRIVTVPNGVDLSRFPPGSHDRGEARRALGVPEGAPAAGLVGRISRGKGHMEFVRAAALVLREIPDAVFPIVGSVSEGEEEYARRVHALARELRIEESLLFAGFREDVPRVLAALDLLVVPSRSEAFGNVVLEGMAASLPVAASGEAGIRDIVADGETGVLFPPDDPDTLAAAMVRLLRDPDARRAMGRKGRERVENLFDRRKRTDLIERLYREVIEEAGGRVSGAAEGT
jgi:glycosyltransferase involved in cell wall biosynthesis